MSLVGLRREPYRLLFPIGVALSLFGVGHWLLFALGMTEAYRSISHSMIQIQGFVASFAAGFLFTMLPRRTQTPPPSLGEIATAALCPVLLVWFAFLERWALAQLFWAILLVTLLAFSLPRLGSRARRRPPAAFVWLPVTFAIGLLGPLLTGLAGALGEQYWELHELGRGLALQGFPLALISGVGGLALPLMTRNAPPRDDDASPRERTARRLHLVAAALLVATFLVETYLSLPLGLLARAAVVGATLILGAELWRPPNRPGLNRWLIWFAAWTIPVGYGVAAVPGLYKAGLHVAFVAGFALLVLAVGAQVILGHGGYESLRDGRPAGLMLVGGALPLAGAARVLMDLEPDRMTLWMGIAAAAFLAGAAAWAALLVPKLRPRQ